MGLQGRSLSGDLYLWVITRAMGLGEQAEGACDGVSPR